MELQASLSEYARRGIAVFALSYDAVETLNTFSQKYSIGFPLLADEGSIVIRQLGHLSRQFAEDHGNYGAAYPATYILNADGIIVEKRIAESERERETATGILEARFGGQSSTHGSEVTAVREPVAIRAYLDSPTYRQSQRLRLIVEMQMMHGWHVYGEPIADGYVPLSVAVEPLSGLAVGTMVVPPSHAFTVDSLDESLFVYEGMVRVAVPLTFVEATGDLVVRAEIRYQACSTAECLVPVTLTMQLPVTMLTHVERPS